jgi:hypothetical protein
MYTTCLFYFLGSQFTFNVHMPAIFVWCFRPKYSKFTSFFETLLTQYSLLQSEEIGKYVFFYSHIPALASKNILCIACSNIQHGRVNPWETKWRKSCLFISENVACCVCPSHRIISDLP